MNLIEILTRPNGQNVTIEEASFVVEKYIEKMKGVNVKINIYKGMPENLSNLNPFGIAILQKEITDLFNAYITASEKLSEYDYKN